MGGPADEALKEILKKGKDRLDEIEDADDLYGIFKDLSSGNKHLVPDDFLEKTLDEVDDFLDNGIDSVPEPLKRFVRTITEKAREEIEDELIDRGIQV